MIFLPAPLAAVLEDFKGQSNLACSAVTSSSSTSVSHSASTTPSSLVSSPSSLSSFGGLSFSAGIVVLSFLSTFSTLANPICSFPPHVGNSPIASASTSSSSFLSVSG